MVAKKVTNIEFITRANIIHNNKYEYTSTMYTRHSAHIIIICKTHGEFKQTAASHLSGSGCPECAKGLRKKTMDTLYGFEHPFKFPTSVIKSKITRLNRYNVEYPFQSKEVQNRARRTHLDKHGALYPLQVPEIKESQVQTCLNKYNVRNVSQRHLSLDTISLTNNVEYLVEQHHNNNYTISKIAQNLNYDISTLCYKFDKFNIEKLRFSKSQGERDLTELLHNHNIVVINNDRKQIAPLELDLFLPEYNIAIEYGGLYWHSDQFKTKNYHQEKYQKCRNLGIRIITIFEDEWLYNQPLVKNKLLHILNLSQQPKVFARKCIIKLVKSKDKKLFYDNNHIQGNGPGSLTYGLYYNNQLVSCMTFIVKQNGVYELNRYATRYNVVGGFSKLLSHFKSIHTYSKIISFADLRWSDGNMYEKNGFILDGVVPPTYEYVINNRRIHRSNFMRVHLPKRLGEIFDPNLTEFQNMDRAGIPRIWNCGLLRYIIKS